MSKYIEQDYIGSAVSHLPTRIIQTEHGIDLFVPVTDAIEIIKNAPGINIVCCCECKYRKHRVDLQNDYCIQHSKVLYSTDGYCSWGDKKTDPDCDTCQYMNDVKAWNRGICDNCDGGSNYKPPNTK